MNEILNYFFHQKNKTFLNDIVSNLYPKFLEIFEKSPDMLNKYLVLIIIEKIVSLADSATLETSLNIRELSLFLTRLLMTEETMIVTVTQIIIELLATKLPSIVINFKRMGLYERLRQLTQERELEKLETIPYTGGLNKFIQMFPKMDSGFLEFSKHESVAEKMENLHRKNSDHNQRELEQKPKFISNIKQSVEIKGNKAKLLREKPPGTRIHDSGISLSKYKKSNTTENENDIYAQRNSQLKLEIFHLCSANFKKIEALLKNKECIEKLTRIDSSLIEIAELLLNNRNSNDFGFKIFDKIFGFIQKEGDITNFELFSFRIIEGLVRFLLCFDMEKNNPALCFVIIKRIFAFMHAFKRTLPNDPKGLYIIRF